MWIRVCMVCALLLFPMLAQANNDTFERLDIDTSGGISLEEFMQGMPNMREKAFELIDKDNDGAISLVEWDEFYSSHNKDNAGVMPFSKTEQGKAPAKDDMMLIQPPKQ